jgi:hypothetical protein
MADIKTYQVPQSKLLAVVPPTDTRTYKAISHGQLIDLTLEGIHGSGFQLGKQTYSMAREGNVANGHYTITDVADSEMQIQIGWQNSYNKSLTLKWAMGVHIFICANGAISGDMGAFKRKHQGSIQEFTPQAIAEYIKTAAEVFVGMQKQRDQMKQIEMTKRATSEILGRMVIDDQIITTTQLNIIKRELEKPTHDYGAANSMWEVYQFVTFSMKELHPSLWMDNHIHAHDFFVNEAGIYVAKAKEIVLPDPIDKFQLNLFDELLVDAPEDVHELVGVYANDDEGASTEIEPGNEY